MKQRLVPAPLPRAPDFDPTTEFPEDIERLVAVATGAGYRLGPQDAAALWRRHADEECASWFAVAGDPREILAALLRHADVVPEADDVPPPPDGYATWLDFAVDTMDVRSEEIERLFQDRPASRQSMRDAANTELAALRRRAGESWR
jgi:hypothetical protein